MGEFEELKQFSVYMAQQVGPIVRQYYRTNLVVDSKADSSPVTIADKKVEETLRGLITKHYPDHGILGEEYGVINPDAQFQWVLDPIDGTKSFIYGGLDFGTMIALKKNDEPVVGVIYQPIVNELYVGDNETAELNGQPIKASALDDLSQAVLLSTDLLNIGKYQKEDGYLELTKSVNICRTWGNCYGYMLVASGLAHIMIDPINSPWDIMALIPIVQGAGAVITDYQGNSASKGESSIAVSPRLYEKVLRMLNS